MKKKNCPLCNSFTDHRLFSTNGYDLLRCGECELIFIDPFPDNEAERIKNVCDRVIVKDERSTAV